MAYPYYQPYTGYYQGTAPMPDQLAQLRTAQQMGPGMQQGGQMPPQQMPAQQQAANGIIWVQGEASAKSYNMIAPGNSALLMDSEATTFYLKTVDANGIPSMRIFDYTERVAAPAQAQAPAADYVTREEFNALAARLEAMTAPSRRRGAKEETENAEPTV